MSGERIVIVGSGQAAIQLAASLRQEGHEGPITLIGDEPGLPYQRPPLSKGYMKEGDPERLVLKPQSFFERNAITLCDATRVASIDRAARTVATDDGATHGYDQLVLATGARNVRPPIAGGTHSDVVELRTLAHAETIRRRLADTRHAIVVGGGFIGLEFAAMARLAGARVTVLESADRLMARAVSPAISDFVLAHHRAAGIAIRLGAKVARIDDEAERVVGVTLADGTGIEGDLVLVATGVAPNGELAAAAGLVVANGIVVDETLATGDPAISAIGDCASVPGPLGTHLRLESVQAAMDQARHLAKRIVHGTAAAYHAVPWFWSDQGALKLQIAGLTSGADRFETIRQEELVTVIIGYRDGQLASVETINAPGEHMAARKLLGREAPVGVDELRDSGFDLRALAKGQAGSRDRSVASA
ncbi:pyridine nucleotide-disulphide oxidoreductase [Aurantimonas manganoxydans SI85-9A1]|uniref:Pyridine nucleotide-disulphide oxidoreductase n=1 Tax=Aurantimonas manganoxydans (strain ATCC BAA-1229 / DSM 21871 / SI85-9A1) TaxID=287752 RepID=Q1YGF9_AURMS|nr:FAD-dependent oxidoreductase [Aurantimonas manganoxydans]EAS49266.1 pyridine nucleotide-disulphide oxidoreductase [Aurantimonas manganoxydans SI85-9A1]